MKSAHGVTVSTFRKSESYSTLYLSHKRLTALGAAVCLFQDTNWPLGELLSKLVVLLPLAFQFPEMAAASITVDECTSASPGFTTSPSLILVTLADAYQSVLAKVCYRVQGLPGEEKSFLSEEHDFVSTLAQMLLAQLARQDTE